VKSLEGPWGTGSKQAVSLIFDDKVCAIMASCDGRNAHLVEQACTRSRVVMLSAWSGDPTLSQAFVPWFFNCVPNDNQQADALIKEIFDKRKLGKIAVISDKSYDSQLALECFVKRSLQSGKPELLKLYFNTNTDNTDSIIVQIKKTGAEALIFFGNIKSTGLLIGKLNIQKITIPVFATQALPDEDNFLEKNFMNVTFISPVSIASESNVFIKEYQKNYGTLPGAVARLAFDGMNLLIHAISSSGTERESLQKALLKINYVGVTGIIKFDEKGNRMGSPSMIQIKNGLQVPVEKY
jgi:branched-chain amino acid transport system substrate-binding protein